MRRRVPTTDELLAGVAEIAGDGFCNRHELQARFRRVAGRDFRRALARAVNGGLLLSRRVRGRTHLAISPEGWRSLRGEEAT
jgi:hypothetical protein